MSLTVQQHYLTDRAAQNPDLIAQALDLTVAYLRWYVVFAEPAQADATALWVGHTWLYDRFDTTPYLAIQSPSRRSGKTRLLEALGLIVREPLATAGVSTAALFRIVQEKKPTVLLDEADAIFHSRGGRQGGAEDLRGLLNAGNRAGNPFHRVVTERGWRHVDKFDAFTPKAIASIGQLPDTLQDRSIVILLKRRARGEPVARFRLHSAEREARPVQQGWKAIRDMRAHIDLSDEAEVPDELHDRAADSWEPLLALADAAGGTWPGRARQAAVALSGRPEVDDDVLSVRLLAAIRQVFSERNAGRLATTDLLEALRADEEQPWAEYNQGRGLNAERLAYLLRDYGIRAGQMKLAGEKVRGFRLDQFTDAFSRYLPAPVKTALTRYPGTPERESDHEGTEVPGEPVVAGQGNGHVPGSLLGAVEPLNVLCDDAEAHRPYHWEVEPDWVVCHACTPPANGGAGVTSHPDRPSRSEVAGEAPADPTGHQLPGWAP